MKGQLSFVLLLTSTMLVGGCATTISDPVTEYEIAAQIVWPEEPEQARIKYVKSFSTPEDLQLRQSFSRRFRDALTGGDDRPMTRPYAVAANAGRVVVADPGAAIVHVFDEERKTYYQLRKVEDQPFSTPIGVALGNDRLYIADSVLSKVFILDRRLKLITTLEGFQRPTCLAVDTVNQRLYVADTLTHEIVVFSLDGEPLFRFGGRGETDAMFNYPSHMAIANDRLFVNDTMNFRVQIFDLEGQHLQTFGKHGAGSGHFTQPKGIAVDSMGHVYVADAMSNRVQIFAQDGTFLLGFGSAGDGPGAFQMPAGVAIWDDLIYVADSFNQRVQVFEFLGEED